MMSRPVPVRRPELILREPKDTDGSAIWNLVRKSKPLDANSRYCNLIQCTHFASTCVVAELKGEVVGWVSGYLKPSAPKTIVVWQTAVSERERGMGLGGLMLDALLRRAACREVTSLQTNIPRSSATGWALFSRFCERKGGKISSEPRSNVNNCFGGMSTTEHVVTVDLPARNTKRRPERSMLTALRRCKAF